MSGITFINRITGATNNLVYLETSDSTATALAANYISSQASVINALNEGTWTWETNDLILLSASDGDSICVINSTFTTLSPIASGVNPFTVNYANFSLTAAQWNGMYATPVSVLGAQGSGNIIVPILIELELIYGTTQFAAGGPVGFQYGNTAHLGGTKATNTEQAADFNNATANTLYTFVPANGDGSQILTSDGADAALYISNSGGAFTTGNSTFSGRILYRVIPVT